MQESRYILPLGGAFEKNGAGGFQIENCALHCKHAVDACAATTTALATVSLFHGGSRMITAPTDRLLSTEQAAEMLNLRPGTLIAWRSRRDAKSPQFLRLGRRLVRYRESVICAWIADREKTARSQRGDWEGDLDFRQFQRERNARKASVGGAR